MKLLTLNFKIRLPTIEINDSRCSSHRGFRALTEASETRKSPLDDQDRNVLTFLALCIDTD